MRALLKYAFNYPPLATSLETAGMFTVHMVGRCRLSPGLPQVDPALTPVDRAWFPSLKLTYDELPSKLTVNLNLRHYNMVLGRVPGERSGKYFCGPPDLYNEGEPQAMGFVRGIYSPTFAVKPPAVEARDAELAVRLWELSEALVGGTFNLEPPGETPVKEVVGQQFNLEPPGDKPVKEVVGQYRDAAVATKPPLTNSSDEFF